MKKLNFLENSGNHRSPISYSQKFENIVKGQNCMNQTPSNILSPINYNNAAIGYSSVRYCEANASDKENVDIMKKVNFQMLLLFLLLSKTSCSLLK